MKSEVFAAYTANQTPGSAVEVQPPGFLRLTIPPGPAGHYRWAQMDDYSRLSRNRFRWQTPLSLRCSARVSQSALPGTWGFGFWNDPFSAGVGIKGTGLRLPALPNTAWFFHASTENHLSLQFDRPACGFMAAVFQSPLIPSGIFLPVYPFAILLLIPAIARLAIKMLGKIVRDNFCLLKVNQTEWNAYSIDQYKDRTLFFINNELIYTAPYAPHGRLGALAWIDNQYAGISPDGRFRSGSLENQSPAWLEIKDWQVTPLD